MREPVMNMDWKRGDLRQSDLTRIVTNSHEWWGKRVPGFAWISQKAARSSRIASYVLYRPRHFA